jgi:hypothetical protein
MKKGWFGVFILLMLTGLASAQMGLSDLLNSLDQGTVILYSIFLLSFAILYFSLSKSLFKGNNTIAGIVAAIISFLIVYWENKSGFDFSGFFYNIGISSDMLMTALPIIIVIGAIFVIIKMKGASLYVFGALLIASSVFVYEGTIVIVLGVILIGIGIFVSSRKKEEKK